MHGPRNASLRSLHLVVLVLGTSSPAALAQQDPLLATVRELAERGKIALSAQPPGFDAGTIEAITAALACPEAVGRGDREYLDLVAGLAEVAIRTGKCESALRWLQPIDTSLAAAEAPTVRHRLAAVLGAALRCHKQEAAAIARLQPAYDALVASQPAADSLLQSVRRQLAGACASLTKWRECLPLALAVVEVDRATPADAGLLLDDLARVGKAYHGLGHRQEAYDTFEQVLQLARAQQTDDDTRVLTALSDFAAATAQLGDYRAAYELSREALAGWERRKPPSHADIVRVKQHMSQVLVQLKDLDNACKLQEEVLAALERDPDRDEHAYALGLQYYARILHSQKRYEESRKVAIDAIQRFEAMLPDDHRDLGTARTLLGVLERRFGDLAESHRLLEAAFRGLQQSLTADHSFTQIAAGDLVSTCRMQGDQARAVELATLLLDVSVVAVQKSQLASRATARLAAIQDKGRDHALSILLDPIESPAAAALAGKALQVAQWLRGTSVYAGRAANRRRLASGAKMARLEADIAGAIQAGDQDRIAGLVRDKETLERSDLDMSRLALPEVAALARALPSTAAAVATVVINRRFADPTGRKPLTAADWVVGLVLLPSGEVRVVDLGPRQDLLDLVDTMSAATHKRLRSAVLDPLRAAAPAAKTLYLALDDVLLLVPWDSLPLASGAMVASELEVRRLTSLLDLVPAVAPPAVPVAATAKLVAVGAVDYGASPAADAGALAPRSGDSPKFAALPHSQQEVDDVVQAFQRAFPTAPTHVLTHETATKAALQRDLPGAAFVHLATHGYFDDANVTSTTVSVGGGKVATTSFELAPFSLSGLALAHANRGRDATGQVPGLLTAAELQHFDFDSCYLAVVSACESGMGAASRGQGLASLQQALHIAGARYVIAALWPVSDAGARHFAQSFYAALWQQPDQPYRALRLAKEAAVRDGLPFADWAAFQLSGH